MWALGRVGAGEMQTLSRCTQARHWALLGSAGRATRAGWAVSRVINSCIHCLLRKIQGLNWWEITNLKGVGWMAGGQQGWGVLSAVPQLPHSLSHLALVECPLVRVLLSWKEESCPGPKYFRYLSRSLLCQASKSSWEREVCLLLFYISVSETPYNKCFRQLCLFKKKINAHELDILI